MKETKELSKSEFNDLQLQIASLPEFQVNGISVRAKVDLTMFDNKVVNALTNTNFTQSCNICGATPKTINNIELVKQLPENELACKLGL